MMKKNRVWCKRRELNILNVNESYDAISFVHIFKKWASRKLKICFTLLLSCEKPVNVS